MDSTLACLTTWMPRQRWYGAKAREPELRVVAAWDLPDPHAAQGSARAVVTTLLVADDGADPVVLYQVPIVARPTASVDPGSPHIIGSPEPGTHPARRRLRSLVHRSAAAIGHSWRRRRR